MSQEHPFAPLVHPENQQNGTDDSSSDTPEKMEEELTKDELVPSEDLGEQNDEGDVYAGKEVLQEEEEEEEVGGDDELVEGDEDDVEDKSKLRIVEGGLNFIHKNFDGIGKFYGLIISYDEPYFRVVYEDTDCEELEVHEVEQDLVSFSSVPENVIALLKNIARTISMGSDASVEKNNTPTKSDKKVRASNTGANKLHHFIRKSFGDMGEYYGLVVSFDNPYYKVVYEDGDSEEIEKSELDACKVASSKVGMKTKNVLWEYGKTMMKSLPTGDGTSSTKKNTQRKRKVDQSQLQKAKASSKNTKKNNGNKKVRMEEGIPKRITSTGISEQKFFVEKSFGEYGVFNGLVVSQDKPYYKVVYEDGDCEDLDYGELKSCLVPLGQVSEDKKELLKNFAKSMTAAASPADFHKTSTSKNDASSGILHEGDVLPDKVGSPLQQHDDAAAKDKPSLFMSGDSTPILREPVESNENFVSKNFFGCGAYYGLLVSCKSPYYKVIYSDGDSEDLSKEEVIANLTSATVIPTKIKNQLQAHARDYRMNPTTYQLDVNSENNSNVAPGSLSTYRDVPEDNIYQQYVGRTFVDLDENITFRVKSVCLHVDYDVLLFKYYDEEQFHRNPALFDDIDSYEYSACSEMLKPDSWCKWNPESTVNDPPGENNLPPEELSVEN